MDPKETIDTLADAPRGAVVVLMHRGAPAEYLVLYIPRELSDSMVPDYGVPVAHLGTGVVTYMDPGMPYVRCITHRGGRP